MAITTYTPALQKSFQATAAALGAGIRVKLNTSGQILVAGATDPAIGTTIEAVAASGYGTVLLFGPSRLVTAGAAITAAALLYPLASGKVDDTGTTAIGLVAGTAATADGDIIEAFDARVGA
jgi:hypothetical protein